MDAELLKALNELFAPINDRLSNIESGQIKIENRLREEINDSESRMLAVIENKVDNAFGALADGHKGLSDKMSRIDEMADAIDEMKGSFVALEALLATNKVIPFDIKKAQG